MVEDIREFRGVCDQINGNYRNPNPGVHVCSNRQAEEIVVHERGGTSDRLEEVIIRDADKARRGSGEMSWRGGAMNLYSDRHGFVLENAEGWPGPRRGMPMHVDDATVKFTEFGTEAERVQKL